MNVDLVTVILGMKVRQARVNAGITQAELAARVPISPSYLAEIEKGRKYPKPDKILRIADVLGINYDELVSIKLDRNLAHLKDALTSPLFRQFPFTEFGVDVSDLVGLLTGYPEKASALLHAVADMARQYNMEEEHFLRAALRSYQELNDNYFPAWEETVTRFAQEHRLDRQIPIPLSHLQTLITQRFNYTLDDATLAQNQPLTGYRSVYIDGPRPHLLINSALHPAQIKFLLAREMGYQVFGLKDRANTSSPDRVESYEQVFNDFQASYFAGALLLPQSLLVKDLEAFFALPTWQPPILLDMLRRYDVTPEMLLYRFSELIPQFFGMALHFLRMHDSGDRYRLVKQLNMNQLPLPTGISSREHFCRRWLTVRLLQELKEQGQVGPHVGIQMSQFLESQEQFLCIGFARQLALSQDNSSVIVGLRVEAPLQSAIHFLNDPAIPTRIINETCERCPLTAEQCTVRGAPPTLWQMERARSLRQEALNTLLARYRD